MPEVVSGLDWWWAWWEGLTFAVAECLFWLCGRLARSDLELLVACPLPLWVPFEGVVAGSETLLLDSGMGLFGTVSLCLPSDVDFLRE